MTSTDGWNDLAINMGRDRKNYQRKEAISHIIIHCTGSPFDDWTGKDGRVRRGANHRFMTTGVSPHYLIKTDGTIVQYVKDKLRAGHAAIQEFLKPYYREGTWRQWKRYAKWAAKIGHFSGEGPTEIKTDAKGVQWIRLKSGDDWKVYAQMDEAASERFGASKGKLPYNFESSERTNEYSIGIEIEHVARGYEDAQYEALIQLCESLCLEHRIPYDRYHIVGHEDTNPAERWGWDPGTVPKVSFDWERVLQGGDWKLEEGEPPLVAPRTFSLLRFPFGPPRRSPLSVYYENEASYGGFFPFGLRGNLHSGVHLYPPGVDGGAAEPAPVCCMGPGWIMAARLAAGTPESLELTGNHTGFVLVRHEFQVRSDGEGTKPEGDLHAVYSLYYHLAPPSWDALEDGPYGSVPWLQTLVRTRFGAVVTAADEGQAPGTQYWAAQELPEELRGTIKVYGEDGEVQDLALEGPADATLAIAREQPVDSAQALAALEEGCVVTFSAPFLTTTSGDRLGFVAPVEGQTGFPSGFLHWELFAPADAGVKEVLDLARSTFGLGDDFFPLVEDEGNDNVWSQEELNEALTSKLPQGDQDQLEGELFATTNYEQGILKLLHDKKPLSFADHSTDDAVWAGGPPPPVGGEEELELLAEYPECRGALTYPYVLKIKNVGGLLSPGQHALKMRVTFEPDDLPEGKVEITEGGDEWSVTLQVPAAATKILLHPEGDLLLDTQTIPIGEAEGVLKQAFETLLPYRWRNVCVRHVSPWSLDAVKACVTKRFALPEASYAPVAWWDLGTGEVSTEAAASPSDSTGGAVDAAAEERDPAWREVPVLGCAGEETSVFGGALLPDKGGRVDTIHPVTGAWLLNALVERRKIYMLAPSDWTFTRGSGQAADEADTPVHWGWITGPKSPEDLTLGDLVHALVVSKGYCTGGARGQAHSVTLVAEEASGRSLTLGTLPYDRGVAVASFELPFWGSWTLRVEGEGGGDLPRTLDVARPLLAEDGGARALTSRKGVFSWSLEFADARPASLPGWVLLRFWRAKRGEDPSGDGSLADFAIPAQAVARAAETTTNPSLTLDAAGAYVVDAKADDDPVPDSNSIFEFSEYKEAAGGTVKLSVSLGRLVQTVRLNYASALAKEGRSTKPFLKAQSLSADGLSVELRCYKSGYDGEQQDHECLKAAAQAACPGATISGGVVKLSVSPPASGAGLSRIEFNPRDALRRLYQENEPSSDDEVLLVAFGFLAPNGGRRAVAAEEAQELIPILDDLRGEPEDDGVSDGVVDLDVSAIKSGCGEGGTIEVWATPSVSLSPLRFLKIEQRLGAASLELTAEFSQAATHSEFVAAKPSFFFTDAAGKPKAFGAPVSPKLVLRGALTFKDLVALPGDSVTVEARLQADPVRFGGQESLVPPLAIEIPTRPRFADLKVEWRTYERFEPVRITCRVLCCGTGKDFGLRVYKGDLLTDLGEKAIFDNPQSKATTHRGHATIAGLLSATLERTEFAEVFGGGEAVRFEFYRYHDKGKVYGVTIEPASIEVDVPSSTMQKIEPRRIELLPTTSEPSLELQIPTLPPQGGL